MKSGGSRTEDDGHGADVAGAVPDGLLHPAPRVAALASDVGSVLSLVSEPGLHLPSHLVSASR